VVICSRHSLQSPAVIREIERALQKEDREHKNVLFPIRIDDYLFDEWEHPRKADVVRIVAGDFRGVNDLAAYAKAFPRFLDALNRPQQASKTTTSLRWATVMVIKNLRSAATRRRRRSMARIICLGSAPAKGWENGEKVARVGSVGESILTGHIVR
jgi:hypothetical protein